MKIIDNINKFIEDFRDLSSDVHSILEILERREASQQELTVKTEGRLISPIED